MGMNVQGAALSHTGKNQLTRTLYHNILFGFIDEFKKMPTQGNDMVSLDFSKFDGLVPAVAQDYRTGEVLMLAFMNPEAWAATLKTGKATYYSRTRQTLWVKGETSGHVQMVKEIRIDCDNDTVLLKIEQLGGAACHTGHASCFYRRIETDGAATVLGKPVFDPDMVYKK
jgi:phosphoribosyl-AMP cyclohydrolase